MFLRGLTSLDYFRLFHILPTMGSRSMINQTWDQTQICTARWPCISWRINRHDSTWPWNMVTLKRLWQLLRNWMIVAVGIVWVWKHWGKEISKLWRWSIRRRRTLTLCLSCTSSPEMSTSWRRCWRLRKCEVTSCQGSTMHWCWVKWKRGWRSWRRWDRRVFEKEHTRYWWNKFLNIWWKHMKVHMENTSVSGAFSCPYCACSSVEGIHGEAWRATLQQRHFVADPTKDSAAGPSTAIISTRKWRFSKLALVSCLALYWDCVVVGFYMVLLDQGWFRTVGHKNKHPKTIRINKDQKSKSDRLMSTKKIFEKSSFESAAPPPMPGSEAFLDAQEEAPEDTEGATGWADEDRKQKSTRCWLKFECDSTCDDHLKSPVDKIWRHCLWMFGYPLLKIDFIKHVKRVFLKKCANCFIDVAIKVSTHFARRMIWILVVTWAEVTGVVIWILVI